MVGGIVALILGACGKGGPPSAETGGGGSEPATTTTTEPYTGPLNYDFEPSSVARGATASELLVPYTGLPVQDGNPACNITLSVEPAANDVQVNLITHLNAPQPGPPFSGCTLEDRTVTVTLAEPLGERDVVWAPSRPWTQDATGALNPCKLPRHAVADVRWLTPLRGRGRVRRRLPMGAVSLAAATVGRPSWRI